MRTGMLLVLGGVLLLCAVPTVVLAECPTCCGNDICEPWDHPSCGDCECGNLTCDQGETCSNCTEDCGTCPACGDQTCSGGETCTSCPDDCGPCYVCGDDILYSSPKSLHRV